MQGWIKLHRQIQNHWVFDNDAYFRAWVIILMEVNHSAKKVLIGSTLFDVETGQSLNSLDTWASKFGQGWTKQKVRTFFKLLENDKMINTQNERKTTRLSVCKYASYQTEQHADNTQSNTSITREQHASNTRVTPNKNDKKEKNEENNKKSTKKVSQSEKIETHDNLVYSAVFPNDYDSEMKEAFIDWADMRKEKKEYLTERALKAHFKSVSGGFMKCDIMAAYNIAIQKEYTAIYPKKLTLAEGGIDPETRKTLEKM